MANDQTSDGGPSSTLTRTAVNLTPGAARDLDDLTTATGLNRTDLINKAVRLLAVLHPHLEDRTLAIREPDGTYTRVVVVL